MTSILPPETAGDKADASGAAGATPATASQMKRFSRARTTYWFDARAEPAYELPIGESVVVETLDAASGRLQHPADLAPYMAWRSSERSNPATGPFRVAGAEPGDELVVHLEGIELGPRGWTRLTVGSGAMKHEIDQTVVTFVDVVDRVDAQPGTAGVELRFDFGVRLPARPMVGVIGTAPADRAISTAHPGPHGGNMDFNDMTVGTIAHLPVWVPGAHFGIGDVHATMGDGEVSGAAVEISAQVTLRVDLVKATRLQRPWFETPDSWITYACAPKLEAAQREALGHMATLLSERVGVTRDQAYLLLTARGDVGIGQAADCGLDCTVRVKFPKIPAVAGVPGRPLR
jgi:amidase